jgi:hypothetical protein
MALPIANNAEGGTNTTTVTTANSGGTSGLAFNTVTIGSGATITFSNTQKAHGTLSYRLGMGATFANTRLIYTTTALGTLTNVYGRLNVFMTALPTATMALAQHMTGSRMGSVSVTTAGKLQWISQIATLAGSPMTTTVPLNQWFRIEWQYTVTAVSNASGTIYLYTSVDSTSLTESLTTSGMVTNAQTNFTQIQLGMNEGGIPNGQLYLDDIALSGTGLPGPAAVASRKNRVMVGGTWQDKPVMVRAGGVWTEKPVIAL